MENNQIVKGFCWHPSMEKEARFKVDRKHRYKLKHYCLTHKIPKYREDLLDELRFKFKFRYKYTDRYSYILYQILKQVKKQNIEAQFEEYLNTLCYPTTYYQFCICQQLEPYEFKSVHFDGAPLPERTSFIIFIDNIIAARIIEDTTIKEIPCTCHGDDEQALLQILPVGMNAKDVICYNSCLRTLFAAFKRATMQVFPVDPDILKDFGEFAKKFIDKYLGPHLKNFDYSYTEWFNKLPLKKQLDIENAEKAYKEDKLKPRVQFGLFCKREKQEMGGKNRAIANIDPITKYIMGPVTWALEDVCDKYFPGYCGKKNWDMLEQYYMDAEQQGFVNVLQGDGSAFDLSQHAEIKEYVDFYIYKQIYDKVHHVNPLDFKNYATNPLRELNAKFIGRRMEGIQSLASAKIYGTVFSGASDTTLMNTIRMALYNHYTLQRKGYKFGIDYKLLSKGDDFIVFTKQPDCRGKPYSEVYYEIWSKKAKDPKTTEYNPHGIGQILKFLIVGDITSIDFCSTCVIRDIDGHSLKIVRRPERMTVLDSYSRAAMKLSRAQKKQYLLDLALALEISHGNLPYYSNYILAYRKWAEMIPGETLSGREGKPKKFRQPDGHRCVMVPLEDLMFEEYGHDFQRTFLSRYSTHQVSDDAVYNFLLEKYGVTQVDIDCHRQLLLSQRTFDMVQQSISEVLD